MSAWHCGINI